MSKKKRIPADLERLIVQIKSSKPQLPAEDVRREANAKYRISHKNIPDDWPGLSAVQKILHKYWTKYEPNPLDSQWSLYTLAQYDIPAEALQIILNAYALSLTWDEPLTIREAMWIKRLFKVIVDIEELTIAAKQCAENEKVNELVRYPMPGLVDGDFYIRAITGKPGISYKNNGSGYELRVLDNRISTGIDILSMPTHTIKSKKHKK